MAHVTTDVTVPMEDGAVLQLKKTVMGEYTKGGKTIKDTVYHTGTDGKLGVIVGCVRTTTTKSESA